MHTTFKLAEISPSTLAAYLLEQRYIQATETDLRIEPAGDGNMNYTCRVTTSLQSFILKQSLPYVAKYPTIPAPIGRILSEYRFYQRTTSVHEISSKMPRILGFDADNHIMALSDCGKRPDFSRIYDSGEKLSEDVLSATVEWLAALHQIRLSSSEKSEFANTEMRQLNHLHIFKFPLDPENGFDLDAVCEGLKDMAKEIQSNQRYVTETARIGELYLSEGNTLVHGDCFPGSILDTDSGPVFIDPEFCHCGFREFDLGVLYAHLLMSTGAKKQANEFLNVSQSALPFETSTVHKVAGIEIMRRIIGVAQLPATFDLRRRRELLDLSVHLVLHEG